MARCYCEKPFCIVASWHGSGTSMVASLEKAGADVARRVGWEPFDTGLLANMSQDVHTVFEEAVRLRDRVGRPSQLPVNQQQDAHSKEYNVCAGFTGTPCARVELDTIRRTSMVTA
ncbi:hypothetical protein [Endozoicomonas sp. 8E]|uniref:hypothetical protein n=1 Tax=Endozoicomonas sp. 8E TaxID=3035692 RepID=UPI002939113A|nr:hypothetical protein [Endozoicomonas sp. 8E]WOG30477.1 hypothetical protein P6910_09185 [Endozoicomonas sp. 8E]